jgi:glycosyltransferase involved in cell wall biosynthesis
LNIGSEVYPIIGVISRYTEWKGLQFIIPAFEKLLTNYPNALLVLANASGDFEDSVRKCLSGLPQDSYRELIFERDVASLLHCFDIFIHTPTDSESEAFGQVYIEALACELPCVFTKSGIMNEIESEGSSIQLVDFKNAEDILMKIEILLKSDKTILQKDSIETAQSIRASFSISRMVSKIDSIYSNTIEI